MSEGDGLEVSGMAALRGRLKPAAVALSYFVSGTAYILLSDAFVATVFGEVAIIVGTLKGVAYIAVSAIVLYVLLHRAVRESERHEAEITESERAARQLFQQNPEAMWVYDQQSLAFLDVNEAAVARYGWSRDAILRMSIADIRPPEDRPDLLRSVREREADHSSETLWRHLTRDGRELPVAITSHRISHKGRPAILVVARDMTHLAAAERALRAREAELEALNEDLSQRVKEMRALYIVLSLCNEVGTPVDDIMTRVAGILPGALRFPEAAAARLTVHGRHYGAHQFPASGPTIQRPIPAKGAAGLLELAYDTTLLADSEPSFLPEEEELVEIIAAELGQALERKRIAGTLRLRDRGLAAAPAGICIAEQVDGDQRNIYVNPAFLKISGYREEDLLGRNCRLLHGRDTDATTVARMGAAIRAEEVFSGEILNYRSNGEPFWNDLLISPVRDGLGTVTHFIGVMRDITERHRSEERIRLLESAVEAAASAIVVTDAEGRIEYANAAFQRITGYTSEEAHGQTLRILKSGEQDPAFYDGLWRTILAGDVWRSPIVNRRKDGTHYRASQVIAPIKDRHGRTTHFVAMQEDTTALYAAEEQLRHAQRLQAVGQLTGGIAHDFNNLLAVILGNLELLDERLSDPDLRELIADPLTATLRGAELTRRLLAFARLQSLSPASIDIEALVLRILNLARPALTEAVEVRAAHRADLWPALIDEGQLETALLNIVLNARDAMPDGGVLFIETDNVHLDHDYASLHPDVDVGDYVMVAISDTGTGMAPDVVAKAFEPFFSTKEPGRGSGLGLSMVYGFAKQSDGHVRIYSEVGHGTTVRLYLPKSDRGIFVREEPAISGMDSRGRTILLVEDDEQVARGIARILAAAGFRVLEAGNADEAMALVEADAQAGTCPDLILTDVILPGGTTGVKLAADVAARGCNIRVLFMSGYTRDAVTEVNPLDPTARLLTKPFYKAELLQQLRELLDGENSE